MPMMKHPLTGQVSEVRERTARMLAAMGYERVEKEPTPAPRPRAPRKPAAPDTDD